jgi:hypothetical protein
MCKISCSSYSLERAFLKSYHVPNSTMQPAVLVCRDHVRKQQNGVTGVSNTITHTTVQYYLFTSSVH